MILALQLLYMLFSLTYILQVFAIAKRMCIIGGLVSTINDLLIMSNDIRPHELTVREVVQQSLMDSLLSTSTSNDKPTEWYVYVLCT